MSKPADGKKTGAARKEMAPGLYERLREYCEGDSYPFHMPGHKRRIETMDRLFGIDITEIDGFDNLHHPAGILKEAQERAARLYGAEETFFLVNGSTAGILAAVGACAHAKMQTGQSGGMRIVMARNCHRSVYHALYLNRLEAEYLLPRQMAGAPLPPGNSGRLCHAWGGEAPEEGSIPFGINGRIDPEDVEAALARCPEACAVLLTSPTYDGVVSDVKAIAQIAHARGIPMIVDEAHGAHFGFHEAFPESSVHLGADLVIHSLHKTLPSLTQTALLHVCGKWVDRQQLRRMLNIYQTTSPSYVLMASMDECLRRMTQRGTEDLERLAQMLERFYQRMDALQVLRLIRTDDPSRILIDGRAGGLSGLQLCAILREQAHLELEMGAPSHALALAAAGDEEEGFERLACALQKLDRELACRRFDAGSGPAPELPQTVLPLYQAWDLAARPCLLEQSIGRVSGEFIYLYPPGIPLLTPGERLSAELAGRLKELRREGFSFPGCRDETLETLQVLTQPYGK